MPFGAPWRTLLNSMKDLPSDATLLTPLSRNAFRVADVQEDYILIEYKDDDKTDQLRPEQFETLHQHVTDAIEGFDLDRLPPNAEPYATVLSIHPDFELEDSEWTLEETEISSSSPLLQIPLEDKNREDQREQSEPSIDEMLNNMGDPQEEVVCPIEGCQYSHRSASSVARHVSGSSTDNHLWEHTSYAGWRDFVRKHGGSPG